jgi:hypothetical protein
MRNLAFLLFLISMSSFASSNFGRWGTTCGEDDFVIDLHKKETPLIVNDNQIVISIHAVEENNTVEFFYNKTLDLGRGGMNFDWNNVSSTTKIAEMKVVDQTGFFRWKGFFDMRKKKYFWISEPDFVQFYAKDGVIELHKCK